MYVFLGLITSESLLIHMDFMTNELQSLLWVDGKNNLFSEKNHDFLFLGSHVISWTSNKWKLPY